MEELQRIILAELYVNAKSKSFVKIKIIIYKLSQLSLQLGDFVTNKKKDIVIIR